MFFLKVTTRRPLLLKPFITHNNSDSFVKFDSFQENQKKPNQLKIFLKPLKTVFELLPIIFHCDFNLFVNCFGI